MGLRVSENSLLIAYKPILKHTAGFWMLVYFLENIITYWILLCFCLLSSELICLFLEVGKDQTIIM